MRYSGDSEFLHTLAQEELCQYDSSQEQLSQISEVRESAWCIQMLEPLQMLKLLPELYDG